MTELFDNIMKYIACEEWDRSYPSHLEQLIWRIEDLQARLDELTEKGDGVFSFSRISEEEIEYVSPQYFSNTNDIIKAIEIAEQRLFCMASEYSIDIDNNEEFLETEMQGKTDSCLQLKFTEIVPAKAA